MNNVTKAGSMDDEDLNDSVDFDFYESNDQESMNTVFNKVYSKPPPGRHRHFHTCSQEKVCYDSFCSSSAAGGEPYQYVNGCLNDSDIDNMKGAVDLIEDKNERIPIATTTITTTTTPTIEDCTLLADENDTQSSLDVSISDDTESNLSDLPDFSDEENGKESSSFANQPHGSKPAGDTGSNPNKQCAIKTEDQRNTVRFKNSEHTDSVVAESGPSDAANFIDTDLSSIDGDDDDDDDDVVEDDDDDDDDDDDEDDVDDDDDSLASVEDNSEDEDECNVDSAPTDKYLKTLGNGKASQPQAILRKNVGITLAERFSLQQKTHAKRNGYSQSSNRSDLNCNTFESDCSSASEMTDVSPLASGDSSPTMVRRCKSAPNPSRQPSSPPFCEQNGLCTATDQDNSNMDMNLIMRAVQEIGKEEYSTRDSSPIRKKNQRTSLSYNTYQTREIERENERLLSEILKLSSNKSYKNAKKLPIKTKVAHSAINRQREQRRIERENEAFLRRLETVKPSKGLSRDEQLAEYSSKHSKYPLNKVSYPGCTTKRPSTASTVNIESTSDPPAKKDLYCRSKTKFKNRPEWISKW
ncbi:cilia- and flagella-associated protein 97 [Octopus bimaculoides]|uniref:Cilia- and flagella-associated protein 97 n=1 Tax=Octopus bimaculoides TaxID=37653 RepID=A0A0L8I8I5_OCTBM|nr:cilia- and flagella-associated protein 97 [Octopus bimaculoides]|eukprot:XP_014786149.1 PREDICTED: cilia- and flagella-associated protein 97-like [Octopus bimaculoides]